MLKKELNSQNYFLYLFISQYRYDVDKSGAIDQKEMVRVMKSIYLMVGHNKTNREALQDQV